MSTKLLPQDIYLLVMKWADPDHFPLAETVGPREWREQYQLRLEQTVAEWLAKGLVAYQYPQHRIDAFVPISHLIGTSREAVSYIDSLIDVSNQLENIRDPQFRPHPNAVSPKEDFVLLGESFNSGIAKAAEILARRVIRDDETQQKQCFHALIDALTLIQAVKPRNAGSTLYAAWSALYDKAKNRFDEIAKEHPWAIEHAFVLACYPICNIGVGHNVKDILRDIEILIKGNQAPAILKSDIKACRDAISARKLIASSARRKAIRKKPSISPLWSKYPSITPRYQYQHAGECHAR